MELLTSVVMECILVDFLLTESFLDILKHWLVCYVCVIIFLFTDLRPANTRIHLIPTYIFNCNITLTVKLVVHINILILLIPVTTSNDGH